MSKQEGLASTLGRFLEGTGLFQVVEAKTSDVQLIVIGRVVAPIPQWMQLVKTVKKAETRIAGEGGMIKIMQDYFLKETAKSREYPDGLRVVFAWVFLLNATNLPHALANLERVVKGDEPAAEVAPAFVPPATAAAPAGQPVPAGRVNPLAGVVKDEQVSAPWREREQIALPGVPPGTDRNADRVRAVKDA